MHRDPAVTAVRFARRGLTRVLRLATSHRRARCHLALPSCPPLSATDIEPEKQRNQVPVQGHAAHIASRRQRATVLDSHCEAFFNRLTKMAPGEGGL